MAEQRLGPVAVVPLAQGAGARANPLRRVGDASPGPPEQAGGVVLDRLGEARPLRGRQKARDLGLDARAAPGVRGLETGHMDSQSLDVDREHDVGGGVCRHQRPSPLGVGDLASDGASDIPRHCDQHRGGAGQRFARPLPIAGCQDLVPDGRAGRSGARCAALSRPDAPHHVLRMLGLQLARCPGTLRLHYDGSVTAAQRGV